MASRLGRRSLVPPGRSQEYDDEAGEKKTAVTTAKRRHVEAGKHPDLHLAGQQYANQEEADAATARLRAAERALNDAATQVNNATAAFDHVIAKARTLEGEHGDRAAVIANKLDEADDKLAPKEPGWLSRTLDNIGDFLTSCGEWLLEHAGTIGAVAGLLALFPTPAAPIFAGIAVAASAVSMAKNLASEDVRNSLMGEYGWKDGATAWASVLGDGLGVVPGVGTLARAGGEVGLAVAVAREGGETMSLGAKASSFMREIVPAFSHKALDVATSSAMRDYAFNGVNVAANTASSLGSAGIIPDEGLGHDSAEAAKAGAAGVTVLDSYSEIATDVGELARGIRI